MKRRCKACLGTYETRQGDARYFHACAPIANPAYQPDPLKPAFNLIETIERPNKRDENIITDPDGSNPREKTPGPGADEI
jgi:hypothetical protein